MAMNKQYKLNLKAYNKAHGTHYENYNQVHLSQTYPVNGTDLEKEDWENFVRQTINLLWLDADESARPIFTRFLFDPRVRKMNPYYSSTF